MSIKFVVLVSLAIAVGSVLLVAGIFGLTFWPSIYAGIVGRQMTLANGSEVYKIWQDPPFDIYLRVYLFNVTNSEDVVNKNAVPKLDQLGPYTFKEERIKENITWNNNETVTYDEYRIWHFDQSMSNGSLDDVVVNLNIPVVAAAYMSRYNEPQKVLLNFLLGDIAEPLFMNASAGQLLFQGLTTKFMEYVEKLRPGSLPYDKFGWFYGKNDSTDGSYTIFTGYSDPKECFLIDLWKGNKNISNWKGNCNTIKGTIGELWPPGYAQKDGTLPFFVSDTCRSMSFDYKGTTSEEGIELYKFEPSESLFANSSFNPENECYEFEGEILPTGLANESSCQFGAPAFLSLPHFTMADPSLAAAVEGLSPNDPQFISSIHIEPATGAPLTAEVKLQINVLVEKISGIDLLANVNKTYIPALWFSESVVVLPSSDLFSTLKNAMAEIPYVIWIVSICIIIVGTALAGIPIFLYVRKRCLQVNDADKQPIIQTEKEENQ